MLSAPVERIGKLITRFELFSKIKNIPGEIIECGVFKGSSLSQFVKLGRFMDTHHQKNHSIRYIR